MNPQYRVSIGSGEKMTSLTIEMRVRDLAKQAALQAGLGNWDAVSGISENMRRYANCVLRQLDAESKGLTEPEPHVASEVSPKRVS